MPELRAVAISGSPRAPSKSKLLAELLLQSLARAGFATSMVDVADLPANALVARASASEIDDAIAAIAASQIVVAASPTYRALYTGVMKALFDLLPPGALAGKICVPVQTGAAAAHFLAVEYGMKPLFASLDGTPIAGVYATDEQFSDGRPDERLAARIETVAAAAVALTNASAG